MRTVGEGMAVALGLSIYRNSRRYLHSEATIEPRRQY